jgi:PAS domain-containing protein
MLSVDAISSKESKLVLAKKGRAANTMAPSVDTSCILLSLAFVLLLLAVIYFFFFRPLKAELRRTKRELARLALAMELSEAIGRLGSWHLDTAAETVKWSDYVFDIHARPHSKGEPTLAEAIAYYHPDDRSLVENAVAHALSDGEDFEFRARIITERGDERPVLARGTCQFERDGAIVGVFGCFVDLSQPKQL